MQTKNIQDRTVAIVVVVCSLLLLGALAWALSGSGAIAPNRTVRLYSADFTGINPGSIVRYGGARAGLVHRIRILSPEERLALPDPSCLVEVTLALQSSLPPLPSDIHATVAAETLLADKFVSLLGGTPSAPPLSNGAVIPSTPPVTIDALVRRIDNLLQLVDGPGTQSSSSLPGVVSSLPSLIDRLQSTLTQVDQLIEQSRGVVGRGDLLIGEGISLVSDSREMVGSARTLVGEGSALLGETRADLRPLLQDLRQAAARLDAAARRADSTMSNLDPEVRRSLTTLQNALKDFQLAVAYGRIFTETIAQHPHRIFWGRRNPPPLPQPSELLRPSE